MNAANGKCWPRSILDECLWAVRPLSRDGDPLLLDKETRLLLVLRQSGRGGERDDSLPVLDVPDNDFAVKAARCDSLGSPVRVD